MITIAAVALTCWVCTLIGLPRKPLPTNEVQELVYARLLGRQHLLRLLALVATLAAFLALVLLVRPDPGAPDVTPVRQTDTACLQGSLLPISCTMMQPGTRVVQEFRRDGAWSVVATFPAATPGGSG